MIDSRTCALVGILVGLLASTCLGQSLRPVVVGTVERGEIYDTKFVASFGLIEQHGVVEFDIRSVCSVGSAVLELRPDYYYLRVRVSHTAEMEDEGVIPLEAWVYEGDGNLTGEDFCDPWENPHGVARIDDIVFGVSSIDVPSLVDVTEQVSEAVTRGATHVGFSMRIWVTYANVYAGSEFIVSRSYGPPADGILENNFLLTIQPEIGTPVRIISSSPPDGFVDPLADMTHGVPMTLRGVETISVSFNLPVQDAATHSEVGPASFVVEQTGDGPPPAIVEVIELSVGQSARRTDYELRLDRPITPGEWTTIIARVEDLAGNPIDAAPFDRIDIGFLPGDVDGSGASAPADILAVVDALNGVVPVCPIDVDRSGQPNPADILRVIDLLNGVNTTRPWLNATLPPRP